MRLTFGLAGISSALPGPKTFTTERLQFAIYLHASERLLFLDCGVNPRDSKVVFYFDDPDGVGQQAELDFDRGAQIAATAIFASQKFLRRKMSETLEYRTHGTRNDHTIEVKQ